MNYQTKDYENYLKKVKEFKGLGWIQNQLYLMEKPNFWSILEYGEKSKSAHEVRSSRMFRWLLDANGTHNLGNIFAHKLVQLIGGDYEYHPGKNEAIRATAEEQRIDVLYKDFSQNIILAIEVKQYAEEHGSQLNEYVKQVAKMIQDQDIHAHYIYLTPLKDEASNEKWLPVSYAEFINIIDEVYAEYLVNATDRYIEDTKKIIADFKDDLQRSIDYLKKDRSDIDDKLTKKEKDLTRRLAHEIEHETDSKHINKLMEINTDKDLELEDLIYIINGAIYAQNHKTNVGVQMLTRKIYNLFSEGQPLATDPDQIITYGVDETLEPLKQAITEKHDLPCKEIAITSRDGQGIYIYHKDDKHRLYLSGDTYGGFPNHGVQLLTYKGEKKIIASSPTINNEKFLVDDDLILEDKIRIKDGEVITLDQLVEEYIIKELKQLSNNIPTE